MSAISSYPILCWLDAYRGEHDFIRYDALEDLQRLEQFVIDFRVLSRRHGAFLSSAQSRPDIL